MTQALQRAYHVLLTVLAMATLILLAVIWLGFTDACKLASALEHDRSQYPYWCAEFWIYRYQTLIGAIAALIAAYTAWVGVQRQMQVASLDAMNADSGSLRTLDRYVRRTRISLAGGSMSVFKQMFTQAAQTQGELEAGENALRVFLGELVQNTSRIDDVFSNINGSRKLIISFSNYDEALYASQLHFTQLLNVVSSIIHLDSRVIDKKIEIVNLFDNVGSEYISQNQEFQAKTDALLKAISDDFNDLRHLRQRNGLEERVF